MTVGNRIKVEKLFHNMTITKNTNITVVIDLQELLGSTDGKIAFQYRIDSAGAADVDITYKISLDGISFFDPTTPMIKENILPAGAGGSATGAAEYDFEFAPFWKIKIAETGNVADVTRADFWLALG